MLPCGQHADSPKEIRGTIATIARVGDAISGEPLAKPGDRPGFLCRKPQARDGQWAGRSV